MGRPAVLKVDIVADARGVGAGVAEADRKFSGLGGKMRQHGKAIGVGLAAAGAAAFAFGKSAVSAYTEAEASAQKLDDAYKRFPATNDRTRASYDKLNSAIARKTKFDDDSLAAGQSVLAQYKLTGAQIQQLTPMLADYAAKTGRDIPAAAEVLGKAMLGKTKALTDVGLKLKDAGDISGNYTQVMAGLRAQVGGFAEGEGKTAAGRAAILSNQFGEVKETVGAKLLPILTRLTTMLLSVIGFVQRNIKVIGPLVAILGGLAAVVVTVNAAARAYAATQAALNVIMALNPVGLVVIAIAALTAGIVLLWKRSETFRSAVKRLWDILQTFVGFSPFGFILQHLDEIWDKVKSVGDAIKNSPLGKLAGGIGGLFSAPVLGMVSPTVGGSPGLGPVQRIATASLGDSSTLGVLSRAGAQLGGGVVVVDRRTVDARVYVSGAVDPVSTAEQISRVLDARDVRLGKVAAWGGTPA